jgi:hypothetical protein
MENAGADGQSARQKNDTSAENKRIVVKKKKAVRIVKRGKNKQADRDEKQKEKL